MNILREQRLESKSAVNYDPAQDFAKLPNESQQGGDTMEHEWAFGAIVVVLMAWAFIEGLARLDGRRRYLDRLTHNVPDTLNENASSLIAPPALDRGKDRVHFGRAFLAKLRLGETCHGIGHRVQEAISQRAGKLHSLAQRVGAVLRELIVIHAQRHVLKVYWRLLNSRH
jgi:hypothetical protein